MLAWMERIDAFDAKGHLLGTASYRVKSSTTKRELEKLRADHLAYMSRVNRRSVRARILPARGRTIDVLLDEKEPASV